MLDILSNEVMKLNTHQEQGFSNHNYHSKKYICTHVWFSENEKC